MSTKAFPAVFSIDQLKEMYARGEWTPQEVVDEILRRVIADEKMNIWITPPALEAIRPYLDRLSQLDPASAPLWGIPFAIKDNIDLAGMRTTAGCPEYAYTPDDHAFVVARLIEAGAIPLGKTNLDQFATGLVGTRSPYGGTQNALRPELISGGSSSGSAVAVARGQAAFALGTDTAGSGRVPAALNRLVGYKPSLGAWSTKGLVPACESLDCITVFAHQLEDVRAVDRVMRAADAADPWSRSLSLAPQKLPRKIYLPQGPLAFHGPYAAEYEEAWQSVNRRLEASNLPVEYIDIALFEQAAALLYEGPWIAERWSSVGEFIEAHPGASLPVIEQILRSGSDHYHSAAALFRAIHQLQTFKLEARELLSQGVLILPTCGGTWYRSQIDEDPVGTNRQMGRYTNHCNLLDLCAVAIPAGDALPDTPFGITLFSLAEQEDLIYGAAEWFAAEEAAPIPPQPAAETTLVGVCGLHMRGLPLEYQMHACGATFIGESMTAPKYQLFKLPTTPAKPGLIKRENGGSSIRLELWEMPLDAFGAFAAAIPAPLGIGKIELHNGMEVPGFICEGYAAAQSKDITAYGGWRSATGV